MVKVEKADKVFSEGWNTARLENGSEETPCPYDGVLREIWALGYYDWVTNEKEK